MQRVANNISARFFSIGCRHIQALTTVTTPGTFLSNKVFGTVCEKTDIVYRRWDLHVVYLLHSFAATCLAPGYEKRLPLHQGKGKSNQIMRRTVRKKIGGKA